jgi:hypothetical protein
MTEKVWVRRLCKGVAWFIVVPAKLKEFFKDVEYLKLKYHENEDKLVVTVANQHDYVSETKNEWIRSLGKRVCHCRGGYTYMTLTIPSKLAKKWISRGIHHVKVVFDGEKLVVSPLVV